MKKRLALIFGTLTLAISLTACGEDPTQVDYNGKSYETLYGEMQTHVNDVATLGSMVGYLESIDMEADSDGLKDLLAYQGIDEDSYEDYGLCDADFEAALLWSEITTEFGDVQTDENGSIVINEDDFTITESGKTTTSDINLVFVKDGVSQDVTFEIVYESWNMEITGISVNQVQTLGQKMANAGMNTLISMSIVFLVLILISLIIYAFNIFPYLEKKKKEKAAKNREVEAPAPEASAPVVEEAAPASDDLELVAVIAAAIAASEGCSTSDFVVRSINRR